MDNGLQNVCTASLLVGIKNSTFQPKTRKRKCYKTAKERFVTGTDLQKETKKRVNISFGYCGDLISFTGSRLVFLIGHNVGNYIRSSLLQ